MKSAAADKEKPKSRYVDKLIKANERREIEKSAAWERMEAKANARDPGAAQGESFVTASYMKQLQVQRYAMLVTAVEEVRNEKRTANAERGMAGFQMNYLAKLRGIKDDGQDAGEAQEDQGDSGEKVDFRTRMEQRLQELRNADSKTDNASQRVPPAAVRAETSRRERSRSASPDPALQAPSEPSK